MLLLGYRSLRLEEELSSGRDVYFALRDRKNKESIPDAAPSSDDQLGSFQRRKAGEGSHAVFGQWFGRGLRLFASGVIGWQDSGSGLGVYLCKKYTKLYSCTRFSAFASLSVPQFRSFRTLRILVKKMRRPRKTAPGTTFLS